MHVFNEKDYIEVGYNEDVVFLLDQMDFSRFEKKIN